jgi:hypothetical protein
VLNTRGLDVLMSSRASLTAAMMAAAITRVERKRSCALSFFLLACDGASHLAHANRVGEEEANIKGELYAVERLALFTFYCK